MKKTFYTILTLIFLPSLVSAEPSVSAVSGNLTHGSSVTVSGSGFGTKAQVIPDLWDTVENQYNLPDGQTIPVGGNYPWGGNGFFDPNVIKYEASDVQRHGNSTAMYKGQNSHSATLEGHDLANPMGYFYLSYWWKFSQDWDSTYAPYKTLRAGNHLDPVNRTFSWSQQSNYVYRTDQGYCQNGHGEQWDDWSLPANTWVHLEMEMNSIGRNYKLYVNGNLHSNVNWTDCTSFIFDQVSKIGLDADGTTPVGDCYLDDIYFDNTFSRIEVCPGIVWSNRGRCEIQIPTAWSQSSITISANQGAFQTGQTAYLYVVDSSGAVNSSGFPVTFGGGGGGDTTPTVPPLNLTVR